MSSTTQLAFLVSIVAIVVTTSVHAEERIYWRANDPVDSSWISSADLDGNGVQTLYACPGVCAPAFPAADGAGGKVYFYLIDSRSAIWRMNLDGSFPEQLVENVLPTDVAVDAVSGKLYWSTSSSIFRSELDGSDVESVLDGLDGPSGLSLDGAGDRLFWIEQSPSRLRRAGLDGTNPIDLVVGTDFRSTTVDLAESKIFWLAGDTLTRANLDGSSVEPLPLLLDAPRWIAFEPVTRRIFVSVDGGIARVSSSLVFVDEIVSGLFGVGKVSVDSIPPPIGVPAVTRYGGAALLTLIGVAFWRRLSVAP